MPRDSALTFLLVALAIGALSELVARILRLWTYRSPGSPVLNILLVFGLIQGLGVAWTVGAGQPPVAIAPVLFMIGALLGLAYEGLNEFALHSWAWPETPLLGLRRSIDKAAAVGVAWGAVPVSVQIVARLVGGL